ncbi:MAG: tetratricopeptide repeat protein [Flammeovirgaceae bacterium]
MKLTIRTLAAFSLILLAVGGCQIYHDTTARYNAYFLAKEKLLEVETSLFDNPKDDYNDVLNVMVKLDTNAGKSQKSSLDYSIEKASLPIQFHKRSKWVDDCWMVVGKARLYQGDYINAQRSFKYVNTNSEDPDARHEALVLLMRTFIEADEDRNVQLVDSYIKKDTIPFSTKNAFKYHMARAHFFRKKENFDMTAQHLEVALPAAKRKKDKARINFILAQIYQLQNNYELAYARYQEVLKNNPGFDLAFYADISSYGLQKFDTDEDVEEAYKYYEKQLKDENNWDLRDKVYYEMGLFEERRQNYDSALVHFNNSVGISKDNVTQKVYSYLHMGEIYYSQKSDYTKAAAYYDSAFREMPKDLRIYEQTEKRNETLQEFLKHYLVIQGEDRLQALAQMDSAERHRFLIEEIEAEKQAIIETKKNEEIREQLKKQSSPPPTGSSPFQKKGEAQWYFYNVEAVSSGKVGFLQKWGNRKLEDDWRRSRKEFTGNFDLRKNNNKKDDEEKEEEESEDLFANVKSLEERIAEIPDDEESMAASNEKLQESLYQLGKVYFYQLQELNNAVETLERFTYDFPKNKNVPEAYYLMYNICVAYDGCAPDNYQLQLSKKYPESLYAQLLNNPNFLKDNRKVDQAVSASYSQAFQLYKSENYTGANDILSNVLATYPTTSYKDKIELLQIMIVGKTSEGDTGAYQDKLNAFIEKYPESEALEYAKQLLAAIPEAK